MEKPAKRVLRRRALVLALSALAGCALAEGGLRLLLFRDVGGLEDLTHAVRRPELFADLHREDLYWKLRRTWLPPAERSAPNDPMPVTGWVSPAIDPRTLVQADEAAIGERRPILLYGDSYALCLTPAEFSWQALLERSPEGRTHALVNFGTAAFGMDQALILLESTIGRFAGRNPLVVFGIFLEEEADRSLLGCRNYPKPRSELVDGKLVLHPLEETDSESWWAHHPPNVASYLWRMLRRKHGAASDEQVMDLARAILARMHRELEAQGIEHFVLGFHSRVMMDSPRVFQWREQGVRAACAELGLRYLCSRPYLLAAVGGREERAGPGLFYSHGPSEGHYNACGNAAVFEIFLQALHGRYESEDSSGVKSALQRFGVRPSDEEQLSELRVAGALARLSYHGDGPSRCLQQVAATEPDGAHMFGLRPEFELPAGLEWTIERPARFVASLDAWRLKGAAEGTEAVRLRVAIDGREVRALELRPGEPVQPLEFELAAGARFALAVEPLSPDVPSCWARFAAARFR